MMVVVGCGVRGSKKVEEHWEISVHRQVAFPLISSGPSCQHLPIECVLNLCAGAQ